MRYITDVKAIRESRDHHRGKWKYKVHKLNIKTNTCNVYKSLVSIYIHIIQKAIVHSIKLTDQRIQYRFPKINRYREEMFLIH